MSKLPTRRAAGAKLRASAERKLAQQRRRLKATKPLAPDRLLHELQVHQIELETQNDELRRTQVALEESRDRYRELYDFAPIGYFTLRRDGLIVEANLKGAEMLGIPRARALRRGFGGFVAAGFEDQWARQFRQALSRREARRSELQLKRADGTIFWTQLDLLGAGEDAGEDMVRLVAGDISERKRAEAEALEYAARLKLLSQRMLRLHETERYALAHELHEEIAQILAALKLGLGNSGTDANEVPSLQRLTRCLAMVDQAMLRVRRMALGLRPPELEVLGLATAVEGAFARVCQGARIKTHFTADRNLPRLDPDQEIGCFRIFEEAMANVLRHAEAKDVWVELRRRNGALQLTVRDNGSGYDQAAQRLPARAKGMIGLLAMQEQAVLGGGRLEIESRPNSGTVVRVLFQEREKTA